MSVDAHGVVPVDPVEGGEFDIVDGAPRSVAGTADQLGLEQRVDRLSEGVVVGLSGQSWLG